ncbi:MAG: ABC transporter ATP-binding protein [Fimbriimonadaceae bacterium]|nr:MAG: ABC transporter ATP-binding protein [Fimbriimonadaceae bacterium]
MRALFRRLDPRITADLRKQKVPISKGLACVAVSGLLAAAVIPLTKFAVGAINRADLPTLGIVCLAVVGVFGLKYFFTRGQTYFLGLAAARLGTDLRRRLFAKLQRLPVAYFNNKREGALQSVLSNDTNVYQNAVTLIRDSIDGPAKAVLALGAVFMMNWQLALVAFAFVPVIAWFVHQNGKRLKRAQAQLQDDLADLTAVSQEAIAGQRVVKAFAAESQVRAIFERYLDRQLASQDYAIRKTAQLRPMVELIGAVSLAAILYLCGVFAKAGILAVEDIVALTLALDLVNQGMRSVANVNGVYNQVQAAADRIHREVLDVPEESHGQTGQRTLPKPSGRIEFENVTFEYPDGTRALDQVSFVIEPGTSLALVGPSGAGKSTIADLLLRFYDPTSGRVLFDGVDLRELDTSWYRSNFGVVPQSTFLFAGTIADNLRLAAPEADQSRIKEAACLAHAHDFISSTPEGYGTVLGERGVRLSGGEGQRLAIARALVRDPLVLLLDEATSNLDAVSEQAVTEALDEAMRRRTTLFIAHRLTTAARADRIAVLRKGRIVELGSHADLMASGGAYAGMFRAFTSGMIDADV